MEKKVRLEPIRNSRTSKLELHDGLVVIGRKKYGKQVWFGAIGQTIDSAFYHCSLRSTIGEFYDKINLISDLIGDNIVDTITPIRCNRSDLEDGRYEISFISYIDDADNQKTWITKSIFQDVDVVFNSARTTATLKDTQN